MTRLHGIPLADLTPADFEDIERRVEDGALADYLDAHEPDDVTEHEDGAR